MSELQNCSNTHNKIKYFHRLRQFVQKEIFRTLNLINLKLMKVIFILKIKKEFLRLRSLFGKKDMQTLEICKTGIQCSYMA